MSGPFDIAIKNGLVHVNSEDGKVVWQPSVFRGFCEQGCRVLTKWDASKQCDVIELKTGKKRKGKKRKH